MAVADFPPSRFVIENLGLGPGQILRRLLRVYYPVQVVRVDVHERLAEDFEEIERTLERLIDAGISELELLAELIGIDPEDAAKLVKLARGYGHVRADRADRLELTELGRESLARGRKLTRFTRPQELLCDGVTGAPLERPFYRVPRVDPGTDPDREPLADAPIIEPRLDTDPRALDAVAKDPRRLYYNVVDEVEEIGEVHNIRIHYFRALLAVISNPGGAPAFRLVVGRRLSFDFGGDSSALRIVPGRRASGEAASSSLTDLLEGTDLDLAEVAAWLTEHRFPCALRDLELRPDGNLSVRLSRLTQPSPKSWVWRDVGRDADSATPCDLLMDFDIPGRLAYVWTDDQALLRRAGAIQAVHELRRIERGELTTDRVLTVRRSAGERVGVTITGADLREAVEAHGTPDLADTIKELPGD